MPNSQVPIDFPDVCPLNALMNTVKWTANKDTPSWPTPTFSSEFVKYETFLYSSTSILFSIFKKKKHKEQPKIFIEFIDCKRQNNDHITIATIVASIIIQQIYARKSPIL